MCRSTLFTQVLLFHLHPHEPERRHVLSVPLSVSGSKQNQEKHVKLYLNVLYLALKELHLHMGLLDV